MLNVHIVIDNEKKKGFPCQQKRQWESGANTKTRIWYKEGHVSVYWKMKCVVTEHENAIVEEVYCQQLRAKEALQWTGHSLLNTFSPCKVTFYKTNQGKRKTLWGKWVLSHPQNEPFLESIDLQLFWLLESFMSGRKCR